MKLKINSILDAIRNLNKALHLLWDAHRTLTFVAIIIALLQGFLPLASAWVGKLIIDSVVISTEKNGVDLKTVIGLVLVGLIISQIGRGLHSAGLIGQELLRDKLIFHINSLLLEKTITLDLESFESPTMRDTIEKATQEASYRPVTILQQILMLLQSGVSMIGVFALLFRFNFWLTLLLTLTVLPSLFVQARFAKESYDMYSYRIPRWRKLNYYSSILSNAQDAKEIKVFRLEHFFLERYKVLAREFMLENRSLTLRRRISEWVFQVVEVCGFTFAYWVVIVDTISGRFTLGDLTLYAALMAQFSGVLTSMIYTVGDIYEQNFFIGNLFDFLNIQPKSSLVNVDSEKPFTKTPNGICFEHVSFRYPGSSENALTDISLTIRSGEKIALVGENGSGKTTLVKLLMRLYEPTTGHIYIDGTNIQNLSLDSLYSLVSVIFQDFSQYHVSASENIGLGDINALSDSTRIENAARKSGADNFIRNLSNGYETILGRLLDEAGTELSGGQWQKLALARVFMRDTPIIILDEPTAALDAAAEYEVFRSFQDIAINRTAILISHRFSTVRMADRIVVLNNGKITEQGSHEYLLTTGGQYATLFNLQAMGYK